MFEFLDTCLNVAVLRRAVASNQGFIMMTWMARKLDDVAGDLSNPAHQIVGILHRFRRRDAGQNIVRRQLSGVQRRPEASAVPGQKQALEPAAWNSP